MHRAALIVAALALAGCGGGEKKDEATPTSTSTATATATATATPAKSRLEPTAVDDMRRVPQGAEDSLPIPSSGHDAGFLHAASASAESVWNPEFRQAGVRYRHTKVAFFRDAVRTEIGRAHV